MNKRDQALAEQRLTYSSGKPCRAGHVSDRYTSNGGCIECLRLQADARKGLAKIAKIKRNTALFAALRERVVLVRDADHDILTKFADILQYSPSTTIDQCRQFIEQLHKFCPMPRALTRADILTFIDYQADGTVPQACINSLSISPANEFDGEIHIMHNGNWYKAEECMEVLRGQRLNATPKRMR